MASKRPIKPEPRPEPVQRVIVSPSVSVEASEGVVMLIMRTYGDVEERIEVRLGLPTAAWLAAQLTSTVMHEWEDMMRALAIGPCEKCSNTRLVTVKGTPSQSTRVRCPECGRRMDRWEQVKAIRAVLIPGPMRDRFDGVVDANHGRYEA